MAQKKDTKKSADAKKEKKQAKARIVKARKAADSAAKRQDKNLRTQNTKKYDDGYTEPLTEDDTDFDGKQILIWQIILFAAAAFLLVLIFWKGSAGWYFLHNAVRGLFGICTIAVPACLFLIVYRSEKYIRKLKEDGACDKNFSIDKEMLKSLLFLIALCGFVGIMYGRHIDTASFADTLKALYTKGTAFDGAGAVSALLAFPLVKFLGGTGARIVSVFLLFIALMLISGKTIGQLFHCIFKPVKNIKDTVKGEVNGIKENAKASKKEYTEEDIEDDQNSIDVPINFGNDDKVLEKNPLDIAIVQTPQASLEPVNEVTAADERSEKGNGSESVNEKPKNKAAADSLEEMIKKITEEPETKKSKREESVVNMLKVNEEFRNSEMKSDDGYIKPSIDLLKYAKHKSADSAELRHKAEILQKTFDSFKVNAEIADITVGPTVIRYEVKPQPGVKVSKITSLADDIALNLAAQGVRIAPIPGKSAIGVEVPNDNRDTVSLREILESNEFQNAKSKLSFAVGKDITGNAIVGDIAKMPHIIIAGSTGSGKSVCTNSIIMSILYNASPSEVKIILIDPKIVEFRVYDGIPHLLIPVVTDPKKAAGALNWAVQEMLRRYKVFADSGSRDIEDYNKACRENPDIGEPMPQIVITIDELADLMMAASKEVEDAICRLAQMARAAGMHLIIATQRPTTDIITGLIKANIPSRIALSVQSGVDSRTILDMNGAEKLLGYGDMLYFPSSIPKPVRVQGCYVSTKEVESVVDFIKQQTKPDYNNDIIKAVEESTPVSKAEKAEKAVAAEHGDYSSDDTELINRAIDIIADAGQASISMLQRRLKLGYARAARIMDELEEMGLIGPSEGAKPRKVKVTPETAQQCKIK